MYTIFEKPNGVWVVKFYSRANNFVKSYEFTKYVDCLQLVQQLQIHLNDNDRNNQPRVYKKGA